MFCLATTPKLTQLELYPHAAHSRGVQGRAQWKPAAKRGEKCGSGDLGRLSYMRLGTW